MAASAPAARTATRTSSKPTARHLRWLYRHPEPPLRGAVRLALSYARRTDLFRYWVEALPSDFGRAFRFAKINPDGSDGEAYETCVVNDQDAHCCCLGHEKHGRCKHVDAARAIVRTEDGR